MPARVSMSQQSDSLRRQSGFTLVEILVVLTIGVIIAAIAVLSIPYALDKARQRSTMTDMRSISRAIESYMLDHEAPPAVDGIVELAALLVPRHAPLLPTDDHWGHRYRYVVRGARGYAIESWGKDGVAGEHISLATKFDFDRDIVLVDSRFAAAPE
jgi:general secretion pathway protein G